MLKFLFELKLRNNTGFSSKLIESDPFTHQVHIFLYQENIIEFTTNDVGIRNSART